MPTFRAIVLIMLIRKRNSAHNLRVEIKQISKRIKSRTLRVLDVGAGGGGIWNEIAQDNWLEQQGLQLEVTLFDPILSDNVVDGKGIKISRRLGFAPEGLSSFSNKEFDLVTAFDVLEHLPKHAGYSLLYELDRLSENSIVRVPNGFLWQAPFTGNPHQAHISAWKPGELRAVGWRRQFGESGPPALVGVGALPKFLWSTNPLRRLSVPFEKAIIEAFCYFLFFLPRAHINFLAIKRTRNVNLETDYF